MWIEKSSFKLSSWWDTKNREELEATVTITDGLVGL